MDLLSTNPAMNNRVRLLHKIIRIATLLEIIFKLNSQGLFQSYFIKTVYKQILRKPNVMLAMEEFGCKKNNDIHFSVDPSEITINGLN